MLTTHYHQLFTLKLVQQTLSVRCFSMSFQAITNDSISVSTNDSNNKRIKLERNNNTNNSSTNGSESDATTNTTSISSLPHLLRLFKVGM